MQIAKALGLALALTLGGFVSFTKDELAPKLFEQTECMHGL